MSIAHEHLVACAVDGPLPDADAARLADALASDPQTLTDLLDHLAISELLARSLDATRGGRAFADSLSTRIDAQADPAFVHRIDRAIGRIDTAPSLAVPSPRRTPTLSPPKRLALALPLAAALLLAACGVAIYMVALNPKPETQNPKPAVPAPLATVTETLGGTLVANDAVLAPGDEFNPGAISLDAGSAEIQQINGVSVILRGATRLTVHDPMHATLAHGSATFDCPHNAKGYTVNLPGGARVVDLGTRFIVQTDGDGGIAIRVHVGSVRLERSGDSSTQIMEPGWIAFLRPQPDGSVRLTHRRISPPEPITGVTAAASSELVTGSFNRAAAHLIDGSGLDAATGAHTNIPDGSMWLSDGVAFGQSNTRDASPSITFDLGGLYLLDSIRVWNYNEATHSLYGRGVRTMRVLVSFDGELFDPLIDTTDGDELFTLAPAAGRDDADFSQIIPIDHVQPVTHVRLRVVTTHEGSDFDAGVIAGDGFAGLSEVRFIGAALDAVHLSDSNEPDRHSTGE